MYIRDARPLQNFRAELKVDLRGERLKLQAVAGPDAIGFLVCLVRSLAGSRSAVYGCQRAHSWHRGNPPVPDARYSFSMLFPVLHSVLL